VTVSKTVSDPLAYSRQRDVDYDNGWNAWLRGAEGPEDTADSGSKAWWRGFEEAAAEYPRDE